MTRCSCGADRRLIDAARDIVEKEGFSGLTVRRLAAQTGINLGLFHYHFRSKARFKRQVLQAVYEDFFKGFSLQAAGEGPALDRLRRALLFLGGWARERRGLILSLVLDAVQGDRQTLDFLQANLGRHLAIVVELISRCQREGAIGNLPMAQVVPIVLGTVGFPKLVAAALEKFKPRTILGLSREAFVETVLSDRAIEQRLDVVFRGLKTS